MDRCRLLKSIFWRLGHTTGIHTRSGPQGAVGSNGLELPRDPSHDCGVRLLAPVREGRRCALSSIARRNDQQRPGREGPRSTDASGFCWGPHWPASVGAEVVSDLRRATCVQHHGRTEPSATNAANARRPQYQRNLAVTSTANDGWKTFTRQGSLVRSQYRPPPLPGIIGL